MVVYAFYCFEDGIIAGAEITENEKVGGIM